MGTIPDYDDDGAISDTSSEEWIDPTSVHARVEKAVADAVREERGERERAVKIAVRKAKREADTNHAKEVERVQDGYRKTIKKLRRSVRQMSISVVTERNVASVMLTGLMRALLVRVNQAEDSPQEMEASVPVSTLRAPAKPLSPGRVDGRPPERVTAPKSSSVQAEQPKPFVCCCCSSSKETPGGNGHQTFEHHGTETVPLPPLNGRFAELACEHLIRRKLDAFIPPGDATGPFDQRHSAYQERTLLELMHFSNTSVGAKMLFSFDVSNQDGPVCSALCKCLRSCIFHNQRPAMEQSGKYDDNELVETRWAFMRLAYELLLRFLHSPAQKASEAAFEHLIDEEFCSGLVSLFCSPIQAEREYATRALHQVT
jgi:hypothetical protein